MARILALVATLVGGASGSADILLATFDGAKGSTLSWAESDDPVMGGKSKGSFTIDKENKVGIFNGTCAIVPSLAAPGFIKVIAAGSTPDVSSCKNLVLNVNSETAYKGFRVSFGIEHYPSKEHFFARGFKSDLSPPVGKAITKCADDPKGCPTQKRLQNLQTISIWGEGVEGDVNLQIKNIRASDCSSTIVV